MRSFFLSGFAAALVACSSNSDPAPSSDAAADTTTTTDVATDTVKPPTDTATAETSDDAPVDDTDGVDVKPPTDKCAGKVCSGSYQACCATTGACYDTRCASCCY